MQSLHRCRNCSDTSFKVQVIKRSAGPLVTSLPRQARTALTGRQRRGSCRRRHQRRHHQRRHHRTHRRPASEEAEEAEAAARSQDAAGAATAASLATTDSLGSLHLLYLSSGERSKLVLLRDVPEVRTK